MDALESRLSDQRVMQLYNSVAKMPGKSDVDGMIAIRDAVVADLNAQLAERQGADVVSDDELMDLAEKAHWEEHDTPGRTGNLRKSRFAAYRALIAAVRAQYSAIPPAPSPQPTPAPSRGDAAWEAVERHNLEVTRSSRGWTARRTFDKDVAAVARDPLTAVRYAVALLEGVEVPE